MKLALVGTRESRHQTPLEHKAFSTGSQIWQIAANLRQASPHPELDLQANFGLPHFHTRWKSLTTNAVEHIHTKIKSLNLPGIYQGKVNSLQMYQVFAQVQEFSNQLCKGGRKY